MPRTRHIRQGLLRSPAGTRGFSLLELMVVIAITAILTAIMFPGIHAARNSCYKLMCATHLHSLGTGITLYSSDHNDKIPTSVLSEQNRPLDQMAVTCLDPEETQVPGRFVLDGLGLLIGAGNSGCYCDAAQCLYCPSHTNTHTYERYESALQSSVLTAHFTEQVWSNYHYVGHRGQYEQFNLRARLDGNDVLVTDGFRTQADYNHGNGMNKLYGDGSIEWWQDVDEGFFNILPTEPEDSPDMQRALFTQAWEHFEDHNPTR